MLRIVMSGTPQNVIDEVAGITGVGGGTGVEHCLSQGSQI